MSKLDIIAVATALAFTAGTAIGGQPFGRASVTVRPGQQVHDGMAVVQLMRLGRDNVYVARDTRFSEAAATNAGAIVVRPRRA